MTKVQRVCAEKEEPRATVHRKHPLASIVVIAIMGVLSGAGGPTEGGQRGHSGRTTGADNG